MFSTRHTLPGLLSLIALIILQLTSTTKSDDSAAVPPTTWKVSESNLTCILLRASISLSVNYTDVGNHNKTHLAQLDIPSSAKSSGSCGGAAGGEQQYIELSWTTTLANSTKPQALNNTLTITFLANSTGNSSTTNSGKVPHGLYAIVKVVAVVHKIPELFPNATNPPVPFVLTLESNSSFLAYPTSLNHSYTCESTQKLITPNPFSETSPQLTVTLDQSQVEAFRKEKSDDDDKFESSEHCPADEISSGSIVGTVILTIGIIVLIALGVAALATYVLKKRRSTGGTGYENM